MGNYNYIVILVGVCGTGKSVVGQKLADRLSVPFIDADSLKVSNGLSEEKLPQEIDMAKWLEALRAIIIDHSSKKGCVISCSVLKRAHRKSLTETIDHSLDWVFMKGSYDYAIKRLKNEDGRARPAELLNADFLKLEAPKQALTIDMNNSESEMVKTILRYMARKYW